MPFVTVAGHSLEYEWIDGGEPTLVFLHEGLGSIRQWRDFPGQVAAATGCRTLLYNRYGYGNSDVLAESRVSVRFMHDEALVSLPALLAQLKIDSPVLVGHSDGASIALIYAGAGHPARVVSGLVTGWHDPEASHLALLEAVAGQELVRAAYLEAERAGYLWHEFGDSCLLLPPLPGGPR